jgi:ABC-type transporter lipoprotein component MlaA/pimeloyl-ACP methyl ester carboxylesterase
MNGLLRDMLRKRNNFFSRWLFVSSVCLMVFTGRAQESAVGATNEMEEMDFPYVEPLADPLERFNRTMMGVNHGIMIGVIKPTSRVYLQVVPVPVQKGINNGGHNLHYPGRLINNLLQAKWTGARDETYRFLINTTVGVGGLFDPATRMGVGKSDEDFGQTFGKWGWDPNFFLMIPLMGPSNDRDVPGSILDALAYPLTWLPPWGYPITYNKVAGLADPYDVFATTQYDHYAVGHYAWTFLRKKRVMDIEVQTEEDSASGQTLKSVFLTYKDSRFPSKRRTRSVKLPGTGEKLRYTYWLQDDPAPVVYIVPGLGSHRRSKSVTALAEMVYKKGFSAVCISSAFHPEFMEQASSKPLPGYTPSDVADVHEVLTRIDQRLREKHRGRLGARVLMGYSMGAFHTMHIAARNQTGQGADQLQFDRYVALDCPVDLVHGLGQLDNYFNAPLDWDASTRKEKILNTFFKVADLAKEDLQPTDALPFGRLESEYLIGLAFRFTLRNIIFSSQLRHNQGVIKEPLKKMRRRDAYREIIRFAYRDYFQKLLIPYYAGQGVDLMDEEVRFEAADLKSLEEPLRASPEVRIFVNRNDFLLREEDVTWYEQTFGEERFTVFEDGGHLGNLYKPEVQEMVMESITDLVP